MQFKQKSWLMTVSYTHLDVYKRQNMAQIQWFPGHMAKAKREIADKIKLIDIVVELVDARAPYSSKNPLFNSVVNNKPRLIVMTKEDLADDKLTQKWIDFYKSKGYYAISVNLDVYKRQV